MKSWQLKTTKIFTGYIINTILLAGIVLLANQVLNTNIFDTILIIGAAIVLVGVMTLKKFERTLPAVSPQSGTSSEQVDHTLQAGQENSIIQMNENQIRHSLENIVVKKVDRNWRYYLLVRSKFEVLSYGILLVAVGFVKYYDYVVKL